MLMMKRREGEAILIGDEIEIQLAYIGRKRVKIAIRAPRNLRVIAKEIQNVRDENQAAAVIAAGTDLASVISRVESTQQRYQGAPVRTVPGAIVPDADPNPSAEP